MRIGIGLPAAIPATPATAIGEWAAAAESAGFDSVGVIDRLVYDNIDPLVALSIAAARTTRVELLTTVLNVAWRRNGIALGKQLASLDRVSGGRLTAGLGLGGWPADHDFCLGDGAGDTARGYLHHYYGDDYLPAVIADTITSTDRLERELRDLAGAGCDDVVLLPCDADVRQVELLADALASVRVSS